MHCKGFTNVLPPKIGENPKAKRVCSPAHTRTFTEMGRNLGQSRFECIRKWYAESKKRIFLLCMILEAIFQVVPHFTFLPPEGQALPIALHRHQKSPRYELINQDRTRLTQRKKSLLSERASIAFGWSPAKPATAFRISFAGNPHPLQRTKCSAVFPTLKRFVRLCGTGREAAPTPMSPPQHRKKRRMAQATFSCLF